MNPRIGSMLFINRGDTAEDIRRWVGQMARARLQLLRLFVFWDQVEPREGDWDWSRFDVVFDEAARYRRGVIPTLFAQSPPGWMRKTGGCQSVGDLDDAEYWERAMDYTRRLVTRWREHPALDSYIPWNEASMEVPVNERTLGLFREFLRSKYHGDIRLLNHNYYMQFNSFEEVGLCDEPGVVGVIIPDRASLIDWKQFAVEYLVAKLAAITREVRLLDPRHPIHVNPHQMLKTMSVSSQSIWREADGMDFMGNSAHPASHMTRFAAERFPQALAMINSLTRSATRHPEKLFWVSELQGGPAVFSGNHHFTPQPADIRAWLWECIGSGAKGIMFWCFNSRDSGGEGGEWGLLNQVGAPSGRLDAVTHVILEAQAYHDLLGRARPPKTRIKILSSEASHLLSNIEASGDLSLQNPRNREKSADALCGAYCMLDDMGFEADFIDERMLSAGGEWEKETEVLVVAGCVALEAESPKALLDFVRRGGTVIADGLCGWKDPDAHIVSKNRRVLEELFGAAVEDIESIRGSFAFTVDKTSSHSAWFTRVSFLPQAADTETVGTWDNGTVAVTKHRCGTGAATRIGTEFFQRYHVDHDPADLSLLRKLIPSQIKPLMRFATQDCRARMRKLDLDGDALVFVFSTGLEVSTTLVFGEAGSLSTPGGEPRKVVQEVPIHLDPGEMKVFIFRREEEPSQASP